MAVYLHLSSITSTSATVFASGTNINYPNKKFYIYLDGYFIEPIQVQSGSTFTIDNLDPGTSYSLFVDIYYNTGYTFEYGERSDTIDFTTSIDDAPIYEATEGVNNSITIEVLNSNNNCSINTYLYDGAGVYATLLASHLNVTGSIDTYSNLQNITYYVQVQYFDTNFPSGITLENSNAETRTRIDFSGGGSEETPYYTYSVADTSVTITIHDINSGYYYSFWIKDSTGTTTIYNSQRSPNSRTQTNPFTITGLNSNTTYLIQQVDYTTQSSGPTSSLIPIEYLSYGSGNQSTQFTTTGSSPPTPSTGGKVHIYVNGVWRTATPYIYTNSGWRSATPYIYTDNGWRSCTT